MVAEVIKELWWAFNIKKAVRKHRGFMGRGELLYILQMNGVCRKVWPECFHCFTDFINVPAVITQTVPPPTVTPNPGRG